MSSLLEIRSLNVSIAVDGEQRPVLRDVTLTLGEGEAHGLVGESGSGKSMTARAITRLLPRGAEVSGELRFAGDAVFDMRREQLRRYRSADVAIIFQDPRAYTNPVRTVGDFLTESLRTNLGFKPGAARARAVELLDAVRVDDPERRLGQYPHELSGGMLQRAMIAAALATEPRLLIADEPTTALDVTTQAEVIAILDEQRRSRGLALLFITHDLDLAAAVCDRTSVMYAGSTVETRPTTELHDRPAHPYTMALLASQPSIDATGRLEAIPGRPLSAFEAPDGCAFADRCGFCEPACVAAEPPLLDMLGGTVRCRRAHELQQPGTTREPTGAHSHD
jgi:oligopeptide/dipeptide ABC transporter ATP-binding protein